MTIKDRLFRFPFEKGMDASIEIKVRFINMDHGYNTELIEKYKVLSE